MAKKPVIAIVFHEKINDYYGDALEQLGGIPIYLQPGKEAFLSPWIDGVMLTGGGDPMASLFGEAKITESAVPDVRRDLFEIQVVRHCVEKNIPLLGICRGMQMINIALGGDIHQDITRCYGSSLEHRQQGNYHIPSHRIRIVEKSHLHRLWNRNSLMVNSCHHQCVRRLGKGLVASAYADDGVIEALEGQGIMAVQYHPERMYPRLEESLLFEDLIKRAKGLL
ncbi:MAG TPA: gamma-glutamyl-gamma-aminobutyrate hydrolase family protein [Firmicutes bacterium]|nr:gamma-glutamyl-gamma-aminobutyrate hydrolase family protein [Bacillota bacterium]